MIRHTAATHWARDGASFLDGAYSRVHRWVFDGGAEVAASSSPHNVRPPYADAAAVDPEEALVVAASSCHLLSFLYVAAKRGVVVDRYDDEAVGEMGTNERGASYVARIVLRPRVAYAGPAPGPDEEAAMHHEAHEVCYIAQSVRSEIVVESPTPA